MTPNSAPAGWYDDPAGDGGRRYWDGSRWTERTQGGDQAQRRGAARGRNAERIPEGYMLLNGQQVRLGQTSMPSTRSSHRGLVVAALIAIGLVALLAAGSAFVANSPDEAEPAHLIEVESQTGSPVDITWTDGASRSTEERVDTPWSVSMSPDPGRRVLVTVRPTDPSDRVACRIVEPDGEILAEDSAGYRGGFAICTGTTRTADDQSSTSARS